MLAEQINIVDLIAAISIVGSLLYVGLQLAQTRRQMRANALQERVSTRISIWTDLLDKEAYQAAQDKIFEHELYRKDEKVHDISELSLRESRAILSALAIELVYFQNLFYQKKHDIIEAEECLPLNYVLAFNNAPSRRHWRDTIRSNGHFPADFIAHIDSVVDCYDAIEKAMLLDDDAEWEILFREHFKVPPPVVHDAKLLQ